MMLNDRYQMMDIAGYQSISLDLTQHHWILANMVDLGPMNLIVSRCIA